jgi:hypothetical protein
MANPTVIKVVATGPQGPQGVTGATGATGPQGDPGVTLPFSIAGGAGMVLAINDTEDGLEFIDVSNNSFSASVTLTRTADTNVYLANDVVGAATGSTAALEFLSIGTSGERIMITSVSLEIDASSVISGEASYRLYLYNVTPPSALGDNTAWDLPSGDRASFLGYVDLGTPVDLGSTLWVETNNVNKQIKLSTDELDAYLVTTGGYTPTSGRVYKITLHAVGV